jgi:hypothetical protein
MELLGDVGQEESRFDPFRDSVCVDGREVHVCDKHTIGSEIILDALGGTLRLQGSSGSSIQSIWR